MSRNINQVYMDNPSTTSNDDDLFYKGNTPYSPSDDSAIRWGDIVSDIGSLNLSYLSSNQEAIANLGQGKGPPLQLQDLDFSGGVYTLTNPCPSFIEILCNNPGNELRLPPAQGSDAFTPPFGIQLNSIGLADVDINLNSGAAFTSLVSRGGLFVKLSDNSTMDGVWFSIATITALNGVLTGTGELKSSDGSVVITPSPSTNSIDLTVPAGAGGTLQDAYDNGDGTITLDNSTNNKPFAVEKDETTIFGSYGVYVSAIRNLEPIPSHFWFQFFEANDSGSNMVQYGAIACDVRDTTVGAVAGFTAMGAAIPSAGIVVPFLYADGQNSQSGSAYPMLINESGGTVDASSVFDVGSTTKGSRPFPPMTNAEFTSIPSKAIGLHSYTTDNNLIKYYDGVAEQTVLTVDNVLAGTNMTVTQNGDGTITLDSAGGGLGAQGNYASFAVHANLTSTSMPSAGTIYPLSVPSAFVDVNSSSFVNELKSISGITTPTTRYTGTATQFFTVNTTVYARGTIASQVDFSFYLMIYKADTSIVQTQYIGRIILQDLIFPYAVPLNGVVQLSTGDAVFVGVSSVSASASCLVNYMTLEIDTVDASQEVAMVWNTVSGTSASMASQNGYIANNAGLVSLTLPVSANVGSLIQVNGYGTGGWSILQNAGQSIIYEGASTTTGVLGHLDSSNSRACISLRCIIANTVFQVENTTGSITLV